ncbi:hypothetical protein BaRGS_00035252 [Batillaria attramentaria]|uniref:Methyltransferase domain-containing protein n=1 Tax=Batillaria attramentaria TaxID=370345 RepID=A0ABD0JEN4_9CAEN
MTVTVYLEGVVSPDGRHISLPLASCAALLIATYAHPPEFHLVFARNCDDINTQNVQHVTLPVEGVKGIDHEFIETTSLPELISNVSLPAVFEPSSCLVRSGLCVVIRHIIKATDAAVSGQHLTDLLGFRQGSLRMCAEVSGWTKLCEVELPQSVTALVHQVSALKGNSTPVVRELPMDLLRLESHFEKPPKVHNDNRMQRQELARLQADVSDPGKCGDVLKEVRVEKSHLLVERVTRLHHGWRKIHVDKALRNSVQCGGDCDGVNNRDTVGENDIARLESLSLQDGDVLNGGQDLRVLVQSLTFHDIKLVHLYSEGVEMTIADLCLFVYLYFLLESLEFDPSGLQALLPRVLRWLGHMTCLPRLESAARSCGLDFLKLKSALEEEHSAKEGHHSVVFTRPVQQDVTQDDMELSRRCRTKYKAIKPEVLDAMKKMKACGIEPVVGSHPRGFNVQLDWETLPPSVHPREGEVPSKRLKRKCQQLENLVTAVQEVAKPGDIIVDFCSGGGHLGIAIAYMLPDCKVYLVENKEESLLKARTRMAALNLTNVVLYQCNLDYFVGKFDIGVCLHACGSATDMVLHQCLTQGAAFVICPCCYGSIQQTHLLTYPRSQMYQDKRVTYTEFLTLGHAADQTEFNIALEQQGRQCMNLVDSDRAQLAREAGYSVTLCSLHPLTCSPKNNLLIGQKPISCA